MEMNAYPIQEIFVNKIFFVPNYQRGFSWEETQCKELLEDIEFLPNRNHHYTGTLVLNQKVDEKSGKLITVKDNSGNTYKSFDIVDGQQRITSIIILMSVIKEFINKYNKVFADGIEKQYLLTKRFDGATDLFKLTLNNDNNDFFQTNILPNPSKVANLEGVKIRSHERLKNAKILFFTYFSTKEVELKNEFYNWITTFFEKITDYLMLSLYFVNSSADVGVIFEVMNNRGKQLTELEKVKNYLLYLITKIETESKEDLINSVNKTWATIFTIFMKSNLKSEYENQLLRTHWLLFYDYQKKNWDGSKSIKERFNLKDFVNTPADLVKEIGFYIDSLKSSAIAFADIENPLSDKSFNSYSDVINKQEIITYSTKLFRMRNLASFRNILIAIRIKENNSSNNYLKMLKLFEKFSFRAYVANYNRSDTGQSTLFKLANDYYHAQIDYNTLYLNVVQLLNRMTTKDNFNNYMLTERDWYRWYGLKYFLYEYEESKSKRTELKIKWEDVDQKDLKDTIEHILPQTPTDTYWQERFVENGSFTKWEKNVNKLGNLCLRVC